MTNEQKVLLLEYAFSLAAFTIKKDPTRLANYDAALAAISTDEAQAWFRAWIADAEYAQDCGCEPVGYDEVVSLSLVPSPGSRLARLAAAAEQEPSA